MFELILQWSYVIVLIDWLIQVSVRVRDKDEVTVMSVKGLLQHLKDQVEAFQ